MIFSFLLQFFPTTAYRVRGIEPIAELYLLEGPFKVALVAELEGLGFLCSILVRY